MTEKANAETIFGNAIEIATPDERKAFLDQACQNDPGLRQEVERLVLDYFRAGSFLNQPVAQLAAPTIDQPFTEKPGAQIGPYKLLQEIGEGGMGVVFLAEQKQPVERRVALKIIKPGMDTRQVIARFEAERQALAMMDHPNIAKVFDAGTTDRGRPYFVMELVNGIPVTQFCDEQHLTARERLELFVPICQAVQHAHQKGIIHRDIKPTNILIALYDGRPVPKVIDFGVAKATGGRLTEKTVFTELGQIVGTLEYMSPEQAQRNQLDIDTRSDVYSLGVLLYELLTGETPFDKRRLRSAAIDELLRIIREEEPPKPSTKLSSSDSLPSIAANRHTEPHKLSTLVRGELDWIVMKALEKDRGRRYETANGFANDVKRYLNDEPVLACPPSTRYRFGKFARRNKGRLVTASLLAAALLVTVGGVGWAVRDREAQRAEVAREKTERQQRVTTQVELLLADVDRLTHQQQWDEALATVRRAEVAIASGEADEAVKEKVQPALKELEFVARLTEIRMATSVWKNDSFDYAGAMQSYGQAFRDFGIDVESLPVATAVAQLKQHPRIIVPVATALDDFVNARLAALGNDDAVFRSLMEMARGIDLNPLRDQLRAILDTKITPETQASLRELASSFDVRKHSPSTAVRLASTLRRSQLVELQEQILRRAQQAYPGDFWVNLNLGNLLWSRKQFAEAVRFLSAALAIEPTNTSAHNNLGLALMDQGKLDDAIAEYRTAIELDPTNGMALSNLGAALGKQGKLDQAIDCFRTAIELDPKLATAHIGLGYTMQEQGKLDQAIAEYRTAIELDPNSFDAHNNLGLALKKQGELDQAIDCFRTAIELDPKLAKAHANLGNALKDQGKLDQAIDCLRTAIELNPKFAFAHNGLGVALAKQGKLDQAMTEYRTAIELDPKFALAHQNLGASLAERGKLEEAVAEYRIALELDPNCTLAHLNLGAWLVRQRKFSEAADCFRRAIELEPNNPRGHDGLGTALRPQGKVDEAIGCFRKAIELDPKYANAHYNLAVTLLEKLRFEESIASLNKALELGKSDQLVRQVRAGIYTSWSWILATAADERQRDPVRAVDLANKAIELQPDHANHWNNLGVAEYRADNWPAAVEALEKADAMLEGGDRQHRMFLAMAHWQLGNKEKARELYAQGAEWIALYQPNNDEFRRFRSEAEELMEITEAERGRLIDAQKPATKDDK